MSFCINDDKLLEKYKTIQTKIKDVKIIELNALPVYADRYIKTKIRTYGIKFILIFVVMYQEMIQNVNLLQSFLLILCWFPKTNINGKYI